MHALMFQMKRAHLRALVGARALSYRTGLTPARHDMMRVIESFGVAGEEYQKRMWRALGLSRATVSIMVRKLIGLGLLQRRRAPRDRRTFLVSLTREGSRRMHRAHCIILRRRPFQRRFERAFGDRSWETVEAVQNVVDALERTARHLGDTSAKLYLTKPPAPPPMPFEPSEPSAPDTTGLPPPSPRALARAEAYHEQANRLALRRFLQEREDQAARANARAERAEARRRARAHRAQKSPPP